MLDKKDYLLFIPQDSYVVVDTYVSNCTNLSGSKLSNFSIAQLLRLCCTIYAMRLTQQQDSLPFVLVNLFYH